MTELRPVINRTLSSQVAEQLRDFIVSGAIQPGERLTETTLATQLSVSRGPLREAILKLIDEGLIFKEAYRGIRVRSISVKELGELYTMRSTLERFAFREAWSKRTDTDFIELDHRLEDLVSARSAGNQAEVIDREIDFHNWVFEVSDHSLLQASWASLTPLVRLYLSIHQQKFGTHGVFLPETLAYNELAKGDDRDAMLAHVDEHMKLGMEEIIKGIDGKQNSTVAS